MNPSPRMTIEPEPQPETTAGTAGLGGWVPVDPLRLLLAVWQGRWWLLLGGVLLGGCGFLLGWMKFDTTYAASVQLIRRELPNSFRASDLGEAFKPRQFSVATIVAMMRSPGLLASVGAEVQPPLSAAQLLGGLSITPEKNTELISITLRGQDGADTVADILNRYARAVVELTGTLQQQEAAELDRFLRDQLSQAEIESAKVDKELLEFSRASGFYGSEKEIEAYLRELADAESRIQTAQLEEETVRFRIAGLERELQRLNPMLLKLAEARDQLELLRIRYTDANPLVIEQQAMVRALESSSTSAPPEGAVAFQPGDNSMANAMFADLVTLQAQREALEQQRKPLRERRETIEAKLKSLPEKSLQYAQIKARQQSLEMARSLLSARQRETQLFAETSPGYYRLFAPASTDDVSVSGRRDKVLSLGLAGFVFGLGLVGFFLAGREMLDDRVLTISDMRRATRRPVLAQLGDRHSMSERMMVLWRFRTWSALFRIVGDPARRTLAVGVTSAKAGEGRSMWVDLLTAAAAERDLRTLSLTNGPLSPACGSGLELSEALENPDQVAAKYESGASTRIALICPDGWTWDAARRGQFAAALKQWQLLPRLAIVIELPPVEKTEALLLAESLPHLLWLSRSGVTSQTEVKTLVNTLCSGEVRLVGVLANHLAPAIQRLPDLGRWGFLLFLGVALGLTPRLQAESEPAIDSPTNVFLSGTAHGPVLAPWQERLTLGPGDEVHISVYGRKDLTRQAVPVGPDGRLTYLQAAGIMASGLTIDELRQTLAEELGQYYRSAAVIVTPAAFRSKKYYLLGKVLDRGVYTLDRPTTLIEAVARARGIATGLQQQNTVEIADLPRAFVVRRGQRLPVDFVELFQRGDLSQNVLLEPEDYIYLPSSMNNEIYVLGSVAYPGAVALTDGATVVSVITTHGSFLPKAYRQRVLVVRGSLGQPETHVVNVAAILRGRETDFPLQPRDIVFVADRPWARAEELADMAITAFITTAITTWTGGNVQPLITSPIIP